MERISALIQSSTRDLSFDDEAFEPAESGGLALALYTVCLTSLHFSKRSKFLSNPLSSLIADLKKTHDKELTCILLPRSSWPHTPLFCPPLRYTLPPSNP